MEDKAVGSILYLLNGFVLQMKILQTTIKSIISKTEVWKRIENEMEFYQFDLHWW